MHPRELIEMAALVAAHGPAILSSYCQLSPTGMEQYWAASKCRSERWGRALRTYSDATAAGRPARPAIRLAQSVVEEILTGEVLTRVWTALCVAADERQHRSEMEPVSRSILHSHLEAKNRALLLLMQPGMFDTETAIEINRMRRRAERWTDLLLAQLLATHDVSEFAVDPIRSAEFAADIDRERRSGHADQVWTITLASLRACFQSGLSPISPNGDLNATIASAILASFPPALFDSTGVFKSLWLTRMLNTTSDAQGMIDELLSLGTR